MENGTEVLEFTIQNYGPDTYIFRPYSKRLPFSSVVRDRGIFKRGGTSYTGFFENLCFGLIGGWCNWGVSSP